MRYALGSVWVAALLLAMAGETMGSGDSQPAEKTLSTIEACMNRSPAPWPDQWRREYLDTIRRAIAPDVDAPQYVKCLDVLSNGFEPYWQGLKKSQDRPLFDVQLAQVRWYTEHLMGTGLSSAEQMQKLKEQYSNLWNDDASALATQFPFLDPNIVQKAKEDHLADCYRKIDAPLLPIFLHPLTDAQLDQLKQRWQDLRYSRVDLWRQLGGDSQPSPSPAELRLPPNSHPHYLLTQRSLAQLLSQIWTIAASPPDYYRSAVANRTNAEKRLLEAKSRAYTLERRLERERSRQFLQTEEISFLLTALIETARYPPSGPADKQPMPAQGGDAYEENDVSSEQ
jgi:hypothetical protein